MKGIIGRKLGMTQIFTEERLIPVTVIHAAPNVITQVKTQATDGYEAIQFGMIERVKEKNQTRPFKGHLAKADGPAVRRLMELRLNDKTSRSVGEQITVSEFGEEEWVDVVATSKGKGFQGVMKRHNFRGGAATHGSMFHRAPGSIGASSYPSRVWKGMRMGGRMGNERVTVKNLKIVKVDVENNLIFIRGAVPGPRRGYVFVKSSLKGETHG
ncbi:MAG TPA: 50S ribosomal protein L3 [Thermoanaerobaculia bacterium]|nr:50S ribosomal protein L3 [Thermoanaerobaculia bacterium]HUM30638.1 50S ribosomal protein L3 [Thermoanaerobaculia bacterium]HXK68954.1 50S ribosomal protein L3 [Thermoanaerobaculia bacterium]